MEVLGSFNFWDDYQEKATTQAFVCGDTRAEEELVVVSFRGTEVFDADSWPSDIDLSWLYELRCGMGKFHGGFLKALGLQKSLGIYTSGQPRVGDVKFGEFMEEQLKNYCIRYISTVYCNDIVLRLPFDDNSFMFKHFGECRYFNSFYQGQIVAEEPNKNYFSLLDAIPRRVNAIWELARSFIIPYTRGADYKEGALLRLIRFIGVLVPGISANFPHIYIVLPGWYYLVYCQLVTS
ncbi:hypothetical protein DCAR_0205318 [Daucus carota subsp. sativus]|uniref:Fungal lipase-type domain-containing protein n=1 Tax=Daucus carota subsp. sativus TaxID=79200 RepID=A0AAF0WD76_DAUCS|nr:hypothetical protein DCAR_0205318 [Daucus carota subsp. sativus]